MGLRVSLVLFLLILTIISAIEAVSENCPPVKCNDGAFDIKFPFSLKTQNCGHRSFELSCRRNQKTNITVINFPSYGDLIVTSISYDTKRFHLLDPRNCVHEVFLNLNLSQTPFSYYYKLKSYTYLNCSSPLSPPSFTEIRCMSGGRYRVYTVDQIQYPFPGSCKKIKTVEIPFVYSPYLSDNTFGLELTWDLPECKECEAGGGHCRIQDKKVWCFYTTDQRIHHLYLSFSVIREWMNWFIYNLFH